MPVENIDVLSRFGNEESDAQLDRLGGAAWQARKAKVKERIRLIADALLKTAAQRELKRAEATDLQRWLLSGVCCRVCVDGDGRSDPGHRRCHWRRFRPTDGQTICGDVGFGKTEVALRAAFVAAMSGKQVAMVVPTLW